MNETELLNCQINTVDTVCSALFGKTNKMNKPTIVDARAIAKSLAAMLLELKRDYPDSANIEEAEYFACGIVLNLGANWEK